MASELAKEDYFWCTGEAWIEVFLPNLLAGTLKPDHYHDLKRFCPNLLDALSKRRVDQTKDRVLEKVLAALE